MQRRRTAGVPHCCLHAAVKLADRGRPGGHPVSHPGPVQQAGVDHGGVHDPQRGLQPGHPERGHLPLGFLVLHRVRRMVGGDAVDGPVGEPGAQRLDVGCSAQRRVHLVDRVIAGRKLVGQQQVMRGDLGRHPPALGLGPADDLYRARGRHVADMQGRADMRGQQAVPGDDRFLGDRRPAGQPEQAGHLALVELGAVGQPGLLRVLGDHAAERLDVLQRPPHQHRVGHAAAIVGEDPHPRGRVRHRAELGELAAVQAGRYGADRLHVAVARLPAEAPDLLDDAGGVGDRVGVGHRVHGGEAAERGGLRAGAHRLGVLAAGLAQMSVQVDEAGQRDQAGARPAPGRPRRLRPGPASGDQAVRQDQVSHSAAGQLRALDQPGLAAAHLATSSALGARRAAQCLQRPQRPGPSARRRDQPRRAAGTGPPSGR